MYKPCLCEHDSHFGLALRAKNGLPVGHDYQRPFHEAYISEVVTTQGTFTVCTVCATTCLTEPINETK